MLPDQQPSPPHRLQGVQEIGSLVAQLVDLGLGLTLNPNVSLARTALSVLTAKEHMLKNAASE